MSFLSQTDPKISHALDEEMRQIASLIVKVINNIDNPSVQNQVRQEVTQMCHRFPVPGIDDRHEVSKQ